LRSSGRNSRGLGIGAHHLHDEDVLSIDLANGDSDTHVSLVENSVGLDRGEGRCEEKLSSDRVVVASGCAASVALVVGLASDLAGGDLLAEVVTGEATLGGSTDTLELASSTAGILEDAALSNTDGDLASRRNTHSLHHLLDTDSVDCSAISKILKSV
jgi:hypothetical protein